VDAHRQVGDMQIPRCGFQSGMSEQNLNRAEIAAALQ